MHRTTVFSDNVVHVRISGEMQVDDQRALQRLVAATPGRPLRVLVTLEGFSGWERSDAWGDEAGFLSDRARGLARMAVVGDERWRDETLLFVGKGFRDTEIAFFPEHARREAEAWLRA